MGAAIIGIAIIVVAIFVAGFMSTPRLSSSNTLNNNIEGCRAACTNLLAKRDQTCFHRAAVDAAQSFLNATAVALATAIGLSVAAALAVGVASAIPIIGPIVASALAVAAAAAATYAIYLSGRYAAAAAAVKIQADGLLEALRLEQEAKDLVMSQCPPDEAAACIGMLRPCP